MENKVQKKCYNCIYASKAFKISGTTHHSCLNPKYQLDVKKGKISPWELLMEFWQTCKDHRNKKTDL